MLNRLSDAVNKFLDKMAQRIPEIITTNKEKNVMIFRVSVALFFLIWIGIIVGLFFVLQKRGRGLFSSIELSLVFSFITTVVIYGITLRFVKRLFGASVAYSLFFTVSALVTMIVSIIYIFYAGFHADV